MFHSYPDFSSSIWMVRLLVVGSFTLGLVGDRSNNLTLDVLFLAIYDEQQRRVHSYTSKVKWLPEKEKRSQAPTQTLFSKCWATDKNTNLFFMCYTVSFDLRFRNNYSVSYQDAPTVCCVVYHHHYTRFLTVHHAKRAGKKKTPSLHQITSSMVTEANFSLWWPNSVYSQGHSTFRGQAEHHLAQGRHPSAVTVCEGRQGSRLQAADTACGGTELRGGAGA